MIFMMVLISHGDEEGAIGGCGLLVRHKIKPKTD